MDFHSKQIVVPIACPGNLKKKNKILKPKILASNRGPFFQRIKRNENKRFRIHEIYDANKFGQNRPIDCMKMCKRNPKCEVGSTFLMDHQ